MLQCISVERLYMVWCTKKLQSIPRIEIDSYLMRSLYLPVLFLCFTSVHVTVAQETASPTSMLPGPTMDQTVAFINETLVKEGDFPAPGSTRIYGAYQILAVKEEAPSLEKPCSLVAGQTIQTVLHLDKTDPLSVSIEQGETVDGVPTYRLVIARAVFDWKIAGEENRTADSAQPPFIMQAENNFQPTRGVVRSITPTELTYVPSRGKVVTIRLRPDTKATANPAYPPFLRENSYETSATAIAVGDLVEVYPGIKPNGRVDPNTFIILRTVKSLRPQRYFGPLFRDGDLAKRTAKAYIHAIVLCHADQKPSLF